eukprot:g26442.t1
MLPSYTGEPGTNTNRIERGHGTDNLESFANVFARPTRHRRCVWRYGVGSTWRRLLVCFSGPEKGVP